jgi:hypothetical protein
MPAIKTVCEKFKHRAGGLHCHICKLPGAINRSGSGLSTGVLQVQLPLALQLLRRKLLFSGGDNVLRAIEDEEEIGPGRDTG